MISIQKTYRHWIKGCLAVIFSISYGHILATGGQTLINKTVVSIGLNLGDAAPAIAYNPASNEYFAVYTDFDSNCPDNQELRGQVINAITGEKSGLEINITNSVQPCVTNSITEPKIVYNEANNEYFIFFKSIGIVGNKSNLYYCSIDGSTYNIALEPTKLTGDVIADPFKDLVLGLDQQTNTYGLGYHKVNASGESTLTINYVNASTKLKQPFQTVIDKSTFINPNTGIYGTKMVYNGTNLAIVFELRLTTGSEIWGVNVNAATSEIINGYFQISPNGQATKFFTNPGACYNESLDEIVITYEQAYFADDPGEEYILSDTIRIQKINPYTGNLIGPTNIPISPLPGSGNVEDKKLPSIIISNLSHEIFLAYYGIRFAAGDDTYNLYLHRIDQTNLTSLSATSIHVAPSIGSQVLQNNSLASIPLVFNKINNQMILGWKDLTADELLTQVWRFENNPPTNISISTTSRIEELPLGTTFATLSASDPDPEDSTPTFELTAGAGSQDNSFFIIQGNELKVNKRLSYEEATTRNIRLRVTDSNNDFDEKNFSLSLTNIDEPPTNITLSGQLSIEENLPASAFSTVITADDEDFGDTHTYSLVTGDSSTNNSDFTIAPNTNVLTLTKSLNYEEASKRFVRIKSVDISGLPFEKAFVINVIDINEKPERLEITPSTIPENDTESVAIVNVIDPDQSLNYSFTMVAGEGDEDNIMFSLSDNNKLKPINALNFEEKSVYSVRLRAWDGVYDTAQAIYLTVTDVNDPPEAIELSGQQIEADQPDGAFIAHITTIDQDLDDTHTYEITKGSEYFFINKNGDQYDLHILNSFAYDFSNPENNQYPVSIKSIDAAGLPIEQLFSLEVILYKDEEKPKILQFEENAKFIDSNDDSLHLSILATDNEKLNTVEFFLRQIRSVDQSFLSPDNIEITKSNDKLFLVTIPLSTDIMDNMGIEYYFKVTDAVGNVDSTVIGHTYWSYESKEFSATNSRNFNGSAESYRIISNPYVLESNKISKIFSDYGSSGKNSWRLFDWSNGTYTELGTLSGSAIAQGNAYWFNKMEHLKQSIFFDKAYTPENQRNAPYLLNLKSGWNLIGNPYPFDLDWNHVLAENNKSESDIKLYTFNGTYQVSTELDEFEGAFVFVVNDTILKIPVSDPSLSNNRIAQTNQFENGWLVKFRLDNGQIINDICGIGMHEQAQNGYDKYDHPLLPRFSQYLDMAFSHPEELAGAFSQDIVKACDNYIWEFVVSTNHPNKHVTLSWNKDEFSGLENQLLLYDVIHDKIISIKDESHYDLFIDQPLTFKAIYGDETFSQETLKNIRIEMLKPYPNPFTEDIGLPIHLPFSTEPYAVDCSIYNLMGEKVFEQKLQGISHGSIEIQWKAQQTRKLKQGIYIYSIQVKNGFITSDFHGRIVKD